jgi:type IV secretory pathway VirB3-like protein
MTGKRRWKGYPVLSRPLMILGVERRWFLLSATLAVSLWNASDSLLAAIFVLALLFGAGRLAWKQDPNMLSLLREATRLKVRYDPGKWTESPWYLDLR